MQPPSLLASDIVSINFACVAAPLPVNAAHDEEW